MKEKLANVLANCPMWVWYLYPRKLKLWLFLNAELSSHF